MKCEFHPNVPAVNLCGHCKIPICGICSRYSDDSVLCERCDNAGALSRFADSQAEKTARPYSGNFGALIEEDRKRAREAPLPKARKEKPENNEKVLMAIVILCSIFIAFRIAYSFTANAPLTRAQVQAQETTRDRIENCMLVFWEIAEQLRNGQSPAVDARCPGTDTPLVIAGSGRDLVVRHPDPQSLGLADIYVSRADPTPVVVGQ